MGFFRAFGVLPVVVLVCALVWTKVCPSNIWDDIAEAYFDSTWAVEPLKPTSSNGTSWSEVLPSRPFHCHFWEAPAVCEVARSFEPLPDDIVLVTFLKTGTTYMQQLTHQLRSGGDMAFRDIHDVVPFIEVNPAYLGDARDVVQLTPRLFKLHHPLSVYSGGRRIVLFRDPWGTFNSLYSFVKDRGMPFARRNYHAWSLLLRLGMPDDRIGQLVDRSFKTAEEYARSSIGWRRELYSNTNYYRYMAEFAVARFDPNVLALCYEDVTGDDKAKWIRVIGKFMKLEMTADLVQKVDHMTSKEFMHEHLEKFDESGISEAINRKNGAPVPEVPYKAVAKVRTEKPPVEGERRIRQQLALEWLAQVKPATGFATYEDLRRAVGQELRERHPEVFSSSEAFD
eukprot:TRINITY_DN28600_c0_g1_i1.p1 TRINITY_DN28600_c0_g1~~TRINITY_DN28600_c0_g1_i1.p1  ORF type:complete len:397 (-),score=64.05 TRINITY_DN28600_c0_g1_i1:5-1195(-)